MNQGLRILVLLLLAFALESVRSGASAEGAPVRLMVVSDIHYLSPACYERSDGLFLRVLRRGDGKMTQYSRELLSALLEEARLRRPDALIVTGDLTFNGEYLSHQELSASFASLREEGIPVWVIPGNHDINIEGTRSFVGDSYERTPGTDPEDFALLYAASLGERTGAGANLSYTVPLREDLQLVMCDAAFYEPETAAAGYYSPGHQAWLREVLSGAEKAGIQVITATHQSVIPHTEFLKESMTVWRGEMMEEDMKESGVCRLNLSGHLHIQHISEDSGIHDIATGAFSVPPFRFGLLEIGGNGEIIYEAACIREELLPEEVNRAARTWFEEIFAEKQQDDLKDLPVSETEKKSILDLAARMNHAYFRGDLRTGSVEWTSDPAYPLLREAAGQYGFAAYLIGQLETPENQADMLHLRLPPLP